MNLRALHSLQSHHFFFDFFVFSIHFFSTNLFAYSNNHNAQLWHWTFGAAHLIFGLSSIAHNSNYRETYAKKVYSTYYKTIIWFKVNCVCVCVLLVWKERKQKVCFDDSNERHKHIMRFNRYLFHSFTHNILLEFFFHTQRVERVLNWDINNMLIRRSEQQFSFH